MKYKLTIRIRKGMEERELESYELDTIHWAEGFRVKDLTVFDKESYLVFGLEEIETPLQETK